MRTRVDCLAERPRCRRVGSWLLLACLAAWPAWAQTPAGGVADPARASAASADAPDTGDFDPLGSALEAIAVAAAGGRFEEGLRVLQKAEAEVSEGYDAELLLWRARLEAGLEHYPQALAAFDGLAIVTRGRSPAVRIEHARVLRSAGRNKDAWTLLETVLDNYPRCGPARLELVDVLVEEGQLVRAGQELDRLIEQVPGLPYAVVLKARLMAKAGEREGALGLLRGSLDRDDERQSLRVALVELLLDAERPREAWLESKPLLGPSAPAAYLELGATAAAAAGEHLEALAAYSLALAKDPARDGALDGLLYLFERAPDVRDAIALSRARSRPEDPEGWMRVIRGRVQAGRSSEAYSLYAGLDQTLRQVPELKLEAVLALRRTGRLEDGLQLVLPLCCTPSTATELGPRAWYERGMLEFEQQRLPDAERSFDQAAFGPLKAEALFNKGLLQSRGQRFAEAARSMEAAVTERRSLSAAWLELGHLYRLYLGDRQRAEECYGIYLQQVGQDPEVEALLKEMR